jgi:hypothetical protein
MKKKIGIVITDGVGYRNYAMGGFLNSLASSFEKVIVYSGIPIDSYGKFDEKVTIIELQQFKEPFITWFFRKMKEISHLFLHKNKAFGIKDSLLFNYSKTKTPRGIITRFIYVITRWFHSERHINFYEKLQFLTFKNHSVAKQYYSLLKKDTLDILFFTHQRPSYLSPLLSAAKQLEIKTCSFIFSWDNLSSKGRMLGEFDSYLVWSKLMKKELLEFYPNTEKSEVFIIGTPQFEPYVLDNYFMSKEDFKEKFQLDPSKKIICYSCADSAIGKNDEIHIRAVLSYMSKVSDLQLLVRTSPADDGSRFNNLKNEFPEIIWNFPKWILTRDGHAEAWSQRIPSKEDVIDLKAILMYVDVNVNMLSTMSLDFMVFDKPVVNTAFGSLENGLYNDQRFLEYIHCKYVVDSNAVCIAKNEGELHQGLKEAIGQPNLRSKERKQILDLEIGAPLKGTSERIVKTLKELI